MSKTQQLLAAATPAPWPDYVPGIPPEGTHYLVYAPSDEDAALIVHLRNTADAAQAVIEAARDAADVLTDHEGLRSKLRAALAAYDEADRG